MKLAFGIIGAIVGVIALGLSVMLITGTLKKETADFRGGVDQVEQVEGNADYRIAAYDRFFALCAQVQGNEATIKSLEEELVTADESRKSVIRATLTGVKSQRAQNIAEYNADASKEATAAKFKASNLPYNLDVNAEETQCAA